MEQYVIKGGNPLVGEVDIAGAKNAALPIISAAIMTDETVTLENLPDVNDVNVLLDSIRGIGAYVERIDRHTVKINGSTIHGCAVEYEYIKKIRASYYLLGALLGKYNNASVPLPGGCNIGSRPIDQHLKGFRAIGANVKIDHGTIVANCDHMTGAHIFMDIVSVGATINIMMAASRAVGRTIIENAAKEPEIADLIDMLNKMGAKISGENTSTLTIEGVSSLHGITHTIINDRIEAGSYAVAAAITKGRLELINANAEHLKAPLDILRKMGVKIEATPNSIIVDAQNTILHGEDVFTDYYPGFPTDLQAQFMALMCVSEGAALVTENIWENRFMHVPELMRMGANINVHGHASAIVRGVKKLSAAPVMSTDLRASFALILAGLVAEGETIVNRVYHLDRGYEHLEEKFKAVGANIERIKESDW